MKVTKLGQSGQATVEYIIIFATMAFVGYQFTKSFSGFMGETSSNINKALSLQLKSGVCESRCFYPKFKNGY